MQSRHSKVSFYIRPYMTRVQEIVHCCNTICPSAGDMRPRPSRSRRTLGGRRRRRPAAAESSPVASGNRPPSGTERCCSYDYMLIVCPIFHQHFVVVLFVIPAQISIHALLISLSVADVLVINYLMCLCIRRPTAASSL